MSESSRSTAVSLAVAGAVGSRSLRVPKAALLKMMAGPVASEEGADDAA